MRIAFFSTMAGMPWGGSEELWSRATMTLLERGHQVAFNCIRWPTRPAPLQRLIESGAAPTFRSRWRMGRTLRQTLEGLRLLRLKYLRWLRSVRPDLVVISFSCLTDDPQIANTCRVLGIPYVIVLQAAGPNNWIDPRSLAAYRAAYTHAVRCYFVSAENRDILETNLAIDMSRGEIVDNPFNVRRDAAPPWPSTNPCWKLASVARIHFTSKSQDLLLRVLRQPKWRARPIQVSLFGSDNGNLAQLRQLIDLYSVHDQVRYGGFADDIEALWSEHHGLLLPSRVEGNALSLIEAMICGRVPITTNVGRAAELIDDDQSGFIAPAATVELVDQVLERAWQRRHDWQAMGQSAACAIRQRHSLRPSEDFAERILDVAFHGRSDRQRAA
jgi:glycosyltransferase involved in cell wall biosynthesis